MRNPYELIAVTQMLADDGDVKKSLKDPDAIGADLQIVASVKNAGTRSQARTCEDMQIVASGRHADHAERKCFMPFQRDSSTSSTFANQMHGNTKVNGSWNK